MRYSAFFVNFFYSGSNAIIAIFWPYAISCSIGLYYQYLHWLQYDIGINCDFGVAFSPKLTSDLNYNVSLAMAWFLSAFRMMTLSNGNIFRVTGPLWGPLTQASDAELWWFLWYAPEQTVQQTRDAGDVRRHRANYDVTVMACLTLFQIVDEISH